MYTKAAVFFFDIAVQSILNLAIIFSVDVTNMLFQACLWSDYKKMTVPDQVLKHISSHTSLL